MRVERFGRATCTTAPGIILTVLTVLLPRLLLLLSLLATGVLPALLVGVWPGAGRALLLRDELYG